MDGVAWHETLQKSQAENEGINGWIVMLLAFLSPFLVLLINGCIMPAIVHFLAKHLGIPPLCCAFFLVFCCVLSCLRASRDHRVASLFRCL